MLSINPDDILTALFRRLNSSSEFKEKVKSLDKGTKRAEGFGNPSATVFMLTGPVDGETDAMRCSVVVKVYVEDTNKGRANTAELGSIAKIVSSLFHKSHLALHPKGKLTHENLIFKSVLVQETLVGLVSELEGEHLASIVISVIVKGR